MTTLTASVKALITASIAGPIDVGDVRHALTYGPGVTFADGVGANQANKVFADSRNLVASASESLDLSGGLTDALGLALVLTKVKAIMIHAASANVNDVVVGGAAANGFITPFGDATDKVNVKPGGTLLLIAPDATGYAVVAGTGDLLKVANSGAGTAVDYDIVIIGCI